MRKFKQTTENKALLMIILLDALNVNKSLKKMTHIYVLFLKK